jgi:hypothetical protein
MMARAHMVRECPVEGAIFGSLIGMILPLGGALVSLIEAHFDESIGEIPRRMLCIAGYLLTDRAARRLTREWCAVLKEYGLPYFRMSACAHGNYPFDKLSIADRIAVEKRLIEIIKRRTLRGFAAIIDLEEFEQYMPQHELIGSAYTFCAHVIIGGIANWVDQSKYVGDIAYVFESGHASQGEADKIMQKIFNHPELKSGQRYASHTFIDKAKSPPTQAADLLSWQTYTEFRRRHEGLRLPRKDFVSLIRPAQDWAVQINKEKMSELATKWALGDDSLLRLHRGDGRLGSRRGAP